MSPDEQAVMDYYATHFSPEMTADIEKQVDWWLLGDAGGVAGKVVLDLGCSYPVDALRWASESAEYIVLDWCQTVLTQTVAVCAARGVPVTTCLADMRAIPLPDSSVDVVLSCSSLDHVPFDHRHVHAEVMRVLRPFGRYIITVPNRETLKGAEFRGPEACGYFRTWTPEEMATELQAAGFRPGAYHALAAVHRMGYWVFKPLDFLTYRRTQLINLRWTDRLEAFAPSQRLLAMIPEGQGWAVEIGTCRGHAAVALQQKGYEVVGLDLFHEHVSAAMTGPRYVVGDMHDLPLRSSSLAVCLTDNGIEHSHDVERALGEMARVLHPGGTVYGMLPLHAPQSSSAHLWSVSDVAELAALLTYSAPGLKLFHVEQDHEDREQVRYVLRKEA